MGGQAARGAAAGALLGKIERSVSWWLGDWWAYGESRYGDRKALVESDGWEGPAYQSCYNAANVSQKFELNRRRLNLPFAHHAEVASLHPDEADRILDWCEETIPETGAPRSRRELRAELSRRRVTVGQQPSEAQWVDKRRAVLRLIHDAEWSAWSDREIARRCGVTHPLVSNLSASERALFTRRRKEAYEALHPETKNGENQHTRVRQVGEPSDRFTADAATKTGQSERTVQRGSTVYQQNTANIDRTPPPPRPVAPAQPAPFPRLEIIERPAPPPPPAPVVRFDHDAAATREKAMNAIVALTFNRRKLRRLTTVILPGQPHRPFRER